MSLPTDSFIRNCHIHGRLGDGPLFMQQGAAFIVRLDGYIIVPREIYEDLKLKGGATSGDSV